MYIHSLGAARKKQLNQLAFYLLLLDAYTRVTIMLLKSLHIPVPDFEKATGWLLKPEGACKGDVCIPLKQQPTELIDIEKLAADMGLPLVAEPDHNIWSLGPDSIGGKTLATAQAPNLTLPDLDGNLFELSSLKGQKILVYAWAPY